MSFWTKLSKLAPAFAKLDVEVIGASADSVARLAKFRAAKAKPFQQLSDPDLKLVPALGIYKSTRHPMALTYPNGAFLQPSVYFFGPTGEVLFSWIQTPKLMNFYGARDRMGPDDVLTKARELRGASDSAGS